MKFHQALTLSLFFLVGCDLKNQHKTDLNSDAILSDSTVIEEVVTEKYFIKTTDGKTFNMEDFLGKKVFINFWATWCKPCIAEMPAIEKAASILEKENYVFLLVSDQSMEKIKGFEKKKEFKLQFAQFNGSLQDLGIQAIPITYIYDSKGIKKKTISGAVDWTSEEILNQLRIIE